MANRNEQHDRDETAPILSQSSSMSSPSSSGVSMWSYLSFGWYTPVLANIKSKIDMGQHPNIEEDQGMPPLPKENCTVHVYHEFETYWKQELQDHPHNPSLMRAIMKALMRSYIFACLLKISGTPAQFVGPLILQMIIPYLLDPSSSLAYGLTLTLTLFLAQIINSLCGKHTSYLCFKIGMRIRTALVFAIFQKSLQIDPSFYRDHPIGQVTNLMSTDVGKISAFVEYMILGVTSPFILVLAIFYLWQLLGFASLGGIFFIVISIPISVRISKWMEKLMTELMKITDERINCNQEVLTNMKTVKLQAWEESFRNKSEDLRKAEVDQMFSYSMAGCLSGAVINAIPLMIAASSFGIYITIAGHSLDATTALAAITVFNIMNFSLWVFPIILNLGIESKISLERIQNFLVAPNVERVHRLTNRGDNERNIDTRIAININGGTFSYQSFKKKGPEEKKLSLKSEIDHKEQESLLVQAKLVDVEEDSAKLEGQPHKQYGSTHTDELESVLPLRRVNFKCHEGEFIAVVGVVGSGKSTLLKSILGELKKVSGESEVRGSIAYFGQHPFIMNDTVKGNILFGKSHDNIDDDLYKLAVKSACLEHDFEKLPAGDQTEIGEKGVNLSGGQKARVAIGRVVYRDADISLLDDCLSAVDAHVGRDLFDKCIVDVLLKDKIEQGTTRKRTVILVTNALQYLRHPKVDRIVVLKDGLIVESGTYGDLVSHEDSQFKSMLETFNESMENENDTDADKEEDTNEEDLSHSEPLDIEPLDIEPLDIEPLDIEPLDVEPFDIQCLYQERRRSSILSESFNRSISSSNRKSTKSLSRSILSKSLSRKSTKSSSRSILSKSLSRKSKLMTSETEEGQIGKVEWKVYTAWAKAAGGIWVVILLFLTYLVVQSLDYIQKFWLVQRWGTSGEKDPDSQIFYLSIYILLYLAAITLSFFKSILPVPFALKASKKFFSALLNSMLAAPMTFFDTTPTGRILNIFSKDINKVDLQLASSFMQLMDQIFDIITSIVVLVTTVPRVSIIFPFLAIFYKQQHSYFSQSNRELTRIDSTARSPIFNLFGEALHGYSTIRAFEAEPALSDRMTNLLDRSQHATYLLRVGYFWLGTRLEFLGALIIVAGCLGFVFRKQADPNVDEVFASMAGLALSYLLKIAPALLYAIISSSSFEANLVSVERIQQYIDIEKEAPHNISIDKELDKSWPSKGSIEFKDYKLRYRTGLPLVLKGLNVTIPSKAKIGVVGRTGAGKSTLMNALTRLTEADSGKIILDGVDISTIGLTKLRSNIAVIPQDPVLFLGTIRTNIDPFNQHSEEKLIDAINRVGLYSDDDSSAVNSLEDKVDQDGSNFSSGQRQLLVIVRALLDGASVVICDEATSSIDAEADARIQRIFRDEFAHCTTLTIAHRLNTIMDSTHILSMADGEKVEFDTRSALLEKGGLFKDLVDKWEDEHK